VSGTRSGPVGLGRPTAVALAALLAVVGCGRSDDVAGDTVAPGSSTPPDTVSGAVTVSAAASLTDVFAEIGDAFTAANPDAEVSFNFGSSGQLSTQIQQGAPADVAAFADTAPMDALASASLLASPAEVFATNRLVLVTPPDDPAGITDLSDLTDAGTVALCAATAPCGTFAADLLATAGVRLDESEVTRGQDVRATLAAVTEGDADAAIVYVTDATAAGDAVRVVELPEADEIVATYPIAALAAAADPEVAAAFVTFVLGPTGQELLGDAGFGPP
jgi:molybdate transport system substrate-binding protein